MMSKQGRRRHRVATILVALVCIASACSSDSTDQTTATGEPTALSTAVATTEPAAVPDATVEPTAVPPTPIPTATVLPTPTAVPTATPTPIPPPTPTVTPTPIPADTTPVVIQGDGWAITEADVARLTAFIEETHQLEFTAEIRIAVSDDIGFEFAPGYEAFNENEWHLLQALGLADRTVARETINQARRDRIRGVCCQFLDLTQVVVEVEATKLETETIVVHELTHALHTQHPALFDRALYETDETPRPFAASGEGVPQYIAFEYFAQAPLEERLEVGDELAIIRDDMVSLVGRGTADHLNFAYDTGAVFVAQIVEARGVAGLFDLLAVPPLTTEQILFPDKYLAGEAKQQVTAPTAAADQPVRATGTIGVAMLMWLFDEVHGAARARQLAQVWAGDQYVVYETTEQICLSATIAIDQGTIDASVFAGALAQSLAPAFPAVEAVAGVDVIELRTCPEVAQNP